MSRNVIVTVATQNNPAYESAVPFGGIIISLVAPDGSPAIPPQKVLVNAEPGQPYSATFDAVPAGAAPGTTYTASAQMIGTDESLVGAPFVSAPQTIEDLPTSSFDVPVSITIAAQ